MQPDAAGIAMWEARPCIVDWNCFKILILLVIWRDSKSNSEGVLCSFGIRTFFSQLDVQEAIFCVKLFLWMLDYGWMLLIFVML